MGHLDRTDLFITTKIPGCYDVKQYVEDDLRLLGTTYVDLMLIHFPKGGNCSAAWEVLEEYHARGVLLAIGVSNFKKPDLQAVMKTAKVTPAVNQIFLNLFDHDEETLTYCKDNGIIVESYSPLKRVTMSEDVRHVADAHGKSVFQVGLRWLLQRGYVITFQSSSKSHDLSNADIFNFNLSEDDMRLLDGVQNKSILSTLANLDLADTDMPHWASASGAVAGALLLMVVAAVFAVWQHMHKKLSEHSEP